MGIIIFLKLIVDEHDGGQMQLRMCHWQIIMLLSIFLLLAYLKTRSGSDFKWQQLLPMMILYYISQLRHPQFDLGYL